jgi:WD40 repeat protein
VGAIAITADGRRAASASEDCTLRLWNLEMGQILAVFSGESWLSSCWLSPEGDTVIAAERTDPGKVKFHILRLCGE